MPRSPSGTELERYGANGATLDAHRIARLKAERKRKRGASLLVLGLVRWLSVNVTTRQPLGCEGLPKWVSRAVGGHCHASLSNFSRRALRSHLRWAQISLLR